MLISMQWNNLGISLAVGLLTVNETHPSAFTIQSSLTKENVNMQCYHNQPQLIWIHVGFLTFITECKS